MKTVHIHVYVESTFRGGGGRGWAGAEVVTGKELGQFYLWNIRCTVGLTNQQLSMRQSAQGAREIWSGQIDGRILLTNPPALFDSRFPECDRTQR